MNVTDVRVLFIDVAMSTVGSCQAALGKPGPF